MKEEIVQEINESCQVKKDLPIDKIEKIAQEIIKAYQGHKKVLLFGNGGSAADAQHLAGELVGRFKLERSSLPAIALTTDTSILTAIGNDYGYDYVFARQVEGLAQEGDIAIGISTSGHSPNVCQAIEKAKEMKVFTIGLAGKDGGKLKDITDLCLVVPSFNTPRIQESHITIGHIICNLVEKALFS
ncbi:D-sedoheptulose 7-phosphate isomerase [bacterium]|nr:D-sedoheptulose 7-phosphate isomerase [bacterium]MBU0900032.1 D-sedoheptulose 7-phosphate isomerase [bacterium]MBU1153750.1 D-sedoheptulose 7-phosphate isomerase [bacterium]MBU1782782.1 D-sedoheptulose 7-phosphate isomerase [bacterium]MBU2600381.1 D-sedoheptulose 7-phosphate isomerase [bacterium]